MPASLYHQGQLVQAHKSTPAKLRLASKDQPDLTIKHLVLLYFPESEPPQDATEALPHT